jgi:hypothetical protein
MVGMAFLLFGLLYMLKDFKTVENKKDPLKILCMVVVVCCFIIMCSERWKTAVYTGLLAVATYAFMKEGANKWVAMGLCTLQLFNVLAIIGSEDGKNGTFLPLGFFSSDNVKSWEKGMMEKMLDNKPADCSGKYESYFNLESIEISHEGHDPKVSHFGFCTDNFLGTVTVFLMAVGTIQFVLTLLSMIQLMPHLGGSAGSGKVQPDQ